MNVRIVKSHKISFPFQLLLNTDQYVTIEYHYDKKSMGTNQNKFDLVHFIHGYGLVSRIEISVDLVKRLIKSKLKESKILYET